MILHEVSIRDESRSQTGRCIGELFVTEDILYKEGIVNFQAQHRCGV